MGKPSPPPAPDYAGAAREQGAANVDAARIQARTNNPNVISPYGTQTVSWNGDTPTLTQTLSPEQQGLLSQQIKTQGLLGGLGQQGAQSLYGVVGKPVDFSGAPPAPSSGADTRQRVINAYMSRANQDYDIRKDQNNSDLVAAGIRPGTKAYADNMMMLDRARNDAYQQAEIAGGNAAAQEFGMDTQRRQQGLSEMLSQRQVPLNEITALLSGSQVQNPFSMPGYAQNTQVAAAPLFAAANAAGNYGTDVYNAKMAYQGQLLGGLMGLGGNLGAASILAPAASDRRLKSNITRIGTHPLGIGWYEYDIFDRHEQGVMADEVLTVMPEAVLTHPDGYLMVRYDLIGRVGHA